MKVEVPDDVLNAIMSDITEGERLQSLSNEELIREYLTLGRERDDELHTNEMMNRLWAEWDQVEL